MIVNKSRHPAQSDEQSHDVSMYEVEGPPERVSQGRRVSEWREGRRRDDSSRARHSFKPGSAGISESDICWRADHIELPNPYHYGKYTFANASQAILGYTLQMSSKSFQLIPGETFLIGIESPKKLTWVDFCLKSDRDGHPIFAVHCSSEFSMDAFKKSISTEHRRSHKRKKRSEDPFIRLHKDIDNRIQQLRSEGKHSLANLLEEERRPLLEGIHQRQKSRLTNSLTFTLQKEFGIKDAEVLLFSGPEDLYRKLKNDVGLGGFDRFMSRHDVLRQSASDRGISYENSLLLHLPAPDVYEALAEAFADGGKSWAA